MLSLNMEDVGGGDKVVLLLISVHFIITVLFRSQSQSCSEVSQTAHRFRWKVFPLPGQTEEHLQEKAEVAASVYL